MLRPLIKHITAFLFLIVFLVPRVADFHTFEHLSDDDRSVSCELCDITSNSQQFDLYLEDALPVDKKLVDTPSTTIVYRFYSSPLAKIVCPTSLYNKPPPQLILG